MNCYGVIHTLCPYHVVLACAQLCLFAEGTRFTPEKHKISVEFAESRGLPVLKHHLFPRTKGFCFILKNMKAASELLCIGTLW